MSVRVLTETPYCFWTVKIFSFFFQSVGLGVLFTLEEILDIRFIRLVLRFPVTNEFCIESSSLMGFWNSCRPLMGLYLDFFPGSEAVRNSGYSTVQNIFFNNRR